MRAGEIYTLPFGHGYTQKGITHGVELDGGDITYKEMIDWCVANLDYELVCELNAFFKSLDDAVLFQMKFS